MSPRTKSKSYQDELLEALADPEEAVAYLNAALEEADMPEVFLLALRNVAEAQGIGQVAEKAKLNRENLYRMLSEKGNPQLNSLTALRPENRATHQVGGDPRHISR